VGVLDRCRVRDAVRITRWFSRFARALQLLKLLPEVAHEFFCTLLNLSIAQHRYKHRPHIEKHARSEVFATWRLDEGQSSYVEIARNVHKSRASCFGANATTSRRLAIYIYIYIYIRFSPLRPYLRNVAKLIRLLRISLKRVKHRSNYNLF